jgi:hypothetical protein
VTIRWLRASSISLAESGYVAESTVYAMKLALDGLDYIEVFHYRKNRYLRYGMLPPSSL